MKISASVYSSKKNDLPSLVEDLDHHKIDAFHVDCNDDMSVFDDIKIIRSISNTPIDLHIISSDPGKYLPLIEEYAIEYVQFQYENLESPLKLPAKSKTRFGLAIVSDSPIEVFEKYENQCSFILLMTTVPGQSGGQFRKDNFQKIRKFRNRFPGKKIHVDGGVNDEVSFILRNMGVNMVISGSYLVNSASIGAALLNMRLENVDSRYKIRDFMIDIEDLPLLKKPEATFSHALQTIEKYELGFVFFINGNNRLEGMASNADVRKGLLKNLNNLNKTSIEDIMNPEPITINQDATISDMLRLIKSQNFIISFLPVVNGQNQLVGAITFFNLIRGEA